MKVCCFDVMYGFKKKRSGRAACGAVGSEDRTVGSEKRGFGLRRRAAAVMLLCMVTAAGLTGCGSEDGQSGGSVVTPEASSAGSAADSSDDGHSRTVFAMDTVMNITYYGGDEHLLDSAEARIEELDKLFSVTDEESEIYAVNRDGKGKVSDDTERLTGFALDMCSKTGGALDISVYPIVRAWGFTTGEFRVPDSSELAELLGNVDYGRVYADGEEGIISLDEGMMIDLGSVAKGYTGDEITAMLRDAGVKSALLDLGGNIQTLGGKTDGSDWRVAIQDPLGDDYMGVVSVSDKAVVTSGGYERYFTGPDGHTYWHIIDPHTGYPAENGLISVTVISESGVYCDALSTSLFVMGREKAIEFWKKYKDFDMILVSDNCHADITPGAAGGFSMPDDSRYSISIIAE